MFTYLLFSLCDFQLKPYNPYPIAG